MGRSTRTQWVLLVCLNLTPQQLGPTAVDHNQHKKLRKKSELMLMRCASNLDLSPSISSQFTLLQPKIAKNTTKNTYFRVQGHSRSSTLISLRSTSPVLVMTSSMSVPICRNFHVRWAKNGRITPFKEECPSFVPLFMGTPFTQRDEILSRNTRDTTLSYSENLKFLSHLGLERYRVTMDGRTDRITIANMHYT